MKNIKALMMADMARPGFQALITRLNEEADRLLLDYDAIDFTSPQGMAEAMHIRVTRQVIKRTIPQLMEKIMNEDAQETPWSFWAWLKNIGGF